MIFNSGSTALDGTFTITVTDANTYTYTCANSGAATGGTSTKVKSFRIFGHETVVLQTTRQDGNYSAPPRAVRLNISTYAAGKATLALLQGFGR